jgi:hypothetical protein
MGTNIKLNSLGIFIFLAMLLIFAVWWGTSQKSFENFINFDGAASIGAISHVKGYSNDVMKLYDNVFFDTKTGNVLRLNENIQYIPNQIAARSYTKDGGICNQGNCAPPYATTYYSTNNPTTPTDVTSVDIITRAGVLTTTPGNTLTGPAPGITFDATAMNSWEAHAADTTYNNTTNTQVFYIPWRDQTFIHIIDLTKSTHAASFLFRPNGSSDNFTYTGINPIALTAPTHATNAANLDNLYGTELNGMMYYMFGLTKDIYYNPSYGVIIVSIPSGSGSLLETKMYHRNNKSVVDPTTFTSQVVTSLSFLPWVLDIPELNQTILCLPYGNDTVIVIFEKHASQNCYTIVTVGRYTASGYDSSDKGLIPIVTSHPINITQPPNNTQPPTPNPGVPPPPGGTGSPPDLPGNSSLSDYYKWYWYWNSPTAGGVPVSQDYILKSQIVPPVCPACPYCPASGGTCSSCSNSSTGNNGNSNSSSVGNNSTGGGGNGGGNSSADNNNNNNNNNGGGNGASGAFSSVANNLINTTGGLANTVFNGATSLLTNTGSGALHLAENTGSGALNLVRDTGSGAVNLVRDTGSGAVNLVRDTGSGAVNLVRDTGSGAVNFVDGVGSGVGNFVYGAGSGVGNFANGVGSGVGNLLRDTGSGAVNIVDGVGSGAGNLLRDTGSGASHFLQNSGSGASHFLQNSGSGAANMVKDSGAGFSHFLQNSGSGASNLLKSAGVGIGFDGKSYNNDPYRYNNYVNNKYGSQGMNTNSRLLLENGGGRGGSGGISGGNYSQPSSMMNPYIYNGTPQKPESNFLPVTADFSRFGR